MIVQSIRLKNIKSYGEGPDGQGLTIAFEAGTNRIAGKNGHGKTTLIESLGYALFLTEPIFEESFQLETYFLRTGKRAGEIDVTFSHRGESYRIERDLGPNSSRQTKVVQLEDGSTCAEGQKEVSRFLCRLFNLPNPRRFSELFWKLIGVRQGRLTWPFDSKPSAAKEFFEPLLDVAVFRECFDSLKPAVDEFIERRHEQEKIRATVEERIRERSDSGASLDAKRLELGRIELRLQGLHRNREDISKKLMQLEATEISRRAAESQLNSASNEVDLARQKREISAQRVRESTEASAVVALAVTGYDSFGKAEQELRVLRAKQAEQVRLQMEVADLEKKNIGFEEKAKAAQSQSNVFGLQKREKEVRRVDTSAKIEELQNRLSASQPEFEAQKGLANRATHYLSDIRHFVSAFSGLLTHGETVLRKMEQARQALGAKDPSALQIARDREETASEALQFFGRQLAAAKAEQSALLKQVQEIGGGLCPFLKEQCRQFDSLKVEGDVKEKSGHIETLQKKKGFAESALRAAQTEHHQRRQEERDQAEMSSRLEQMILDFLSSFERLSWGKTSEAVNGLREWIRQVGPMPGCPNPEAVRVDATTFESSHWRNIEYLRELKIWWQETETVVQEGVDLVIAEEVGRNSDQRDKVNRIEQLQQISAEIEKLAVAEDEQREVAATCHRNSMELAKSIVELERRYGAFGFLSNEIALLEKKQQDHRDDYRRYLGAKPLAEERIARELELDTRKEQEQRAILELRLRENALSQLDKGFDASALVIVRRESEEISAAVAGESASLEISRRETEREEKRFCEWQEACAARDEIDRVIRRLTAAVKLTELARVTLRDSAPIVAQHLCDRIAGQAQRIFNRINHDPVELRWEAAPRYSLRVIPGDRRFAMMSGGEQTKLALAMTLAMIQEFSGLRFCVFDEPTYGVDAESREKLGDALLESQKAADLEQLILVSHDDAFDGKTEHSIFLRKSAGQGTEVVQFSAQVNRRESQNSIACEA
jgi:DNA repair protein SbcC/Rad50